MTSATVNDPLIAAPRGSIAQALAYIAPQDPWRPDFLAAYLAELWAVCEAARLDFVLLVGQSIVETAFYSSSWWINRGNPAGLGVTGDPAQDAVSPVFATGAAAARAQAAHMLLYCTGQISGGSGLAPIDDPRYSAYLSAYGATARAAKLADLGSGNWATDPNYAPQIAARASGILATPIPTNGENPMALNMAQDLIPLPPFQTKIVTDAQNNAWDDLGKRAVKGFVLHRMLGSLDGTDQYFRRGAASTGLTDWGSDHQSGTVYLWNSPLGYGGAGASPNRAPWASGVFNVNGDAYGDGLAFVNKYGIEAVNRDETAWEISGQYNDPWSDAAQQAAAQACAHYAHNYGIQWDQFPIHPQDGFSFVRWHQEITGPKEKICPGPVVMAATDAWIERVRGILKAAQAAVAPPAPTPYAKPKPIAKATSSVLPYVKTAQTAATVTPRVTATKTAQATGPDLAAGTSVNLAWVLWSQKDQAFWVVDQAGSRLPAAAFKL